MRLAIMRRRVLPLLALVALASSVSLQGWTDIGHKWATSSVVYYVNPQSIYVSPNAGDSWLPIVRDLPAVLSVEVQTLS